MKPVVIEKSMQTFMKQRSHFICLSPASCPSPPHYFNNHHHPILTITTTSKQEPIFHRVLSLLSPCADVSFLIHDILPCNKSKMTGATSVAASAYPSLPVCCEVVSPLCCLSFFDLRLLISSVFSYSK